MNYEICKQVQNRFDEIVNKELLVEKHDRLATLIIHNQRKGKTFFEIPINDENFSHDFIDLRNLAGSGRCDPKTKFNVDQLPKLLGLSILYFSYDYQHLCVSLERSRLIPHDIQVKNVTQVKDDGHVLNTKFMYSTDFIDMVKREKKLMHICQKHSNSRTDCYRLLPWLLNL